MVIVNSVRGSHVFINVVSLFRLPSPIVLIRGSYVAFGVHLRLGNEAAGFVEVT